ncbi:unnamed protein product [Musa textilis]
MAPTHQSRGIQNIKWASQDLIPSLRGLLYSIKVARCDSCAGHIQQSQQQQTTEEADGGAYSLFGVVYCKRKQEKGIR